MTYEAMRKAVEAYFSDKSRSQEATACGLEELKEEIDIMIDSLDIED